MGDNIKKVILIFIFFLCGCSNKLICTYTKVMEDIIIKNKVVYNFKNNIYNQIDIMIFKDKDSAQNYFNEIIEYKNEYNLKINSNKIISEVTKAIAQGYSYKMVKEQYEGYNYKCK